MLVPKFFMLQATEIHSLNSQARVASSRGSALIMMNKVLMQCNVDSMNKYGTSWLTITSEIVLMVRAISFNIF